MGADGDDFKKAYWKDNISLISKLLFVWFLVSCGFGIIFVDWLNKIEFSGLKLGFWFAQQGSMYFFVAIIFIYAKKMEALEKKYGIDE